MRRNADGSLEGTPEELARYEQELRRAETPPLVVRARPPVYVLDDPVPTNRNRDYPPGLRPSYRHWCAMPGGN